MRIPQTPVRLVQNASVSDRRGTLIWCTRVASKGTEIRGIYFPHTRLRPMIGTATYGERMELGEVAKGLGFGLAAVGRPGYINVGRAADLPPGRGVAAMRARAVELLDFAYAHGVRYFDAARSYGRAEEFLAGWLAGAPDRGGVAVGSKWGYTYTADWQV